MTEVRHILFIELLGGIGDVLIALPAIHALGLTYPQAMLTVLTFAPGGELFQHDRMIHRVLFAEKEKARLSVQKLLESESFDLIVSDTNYDNIGELIASSGAEKTVANLWRSPFLNRNSAPPDNERVGDRFLRILQAEGVISLDVMSPELGRLHLPVSAVDAARRKLAAAFRPLVALISDAGMAIKCWPIDRFIEVGRQLQQQYGATILVPVGADEASAIALADAIGGSTLLWPRGFLTELAAVLSHADLAIAADTGPARIAAALNVPTITLFGPSWHGRYGQPDPHANLQGFSECPERIIANFTEQACWYSGNCPFEWSTCLEDISADAVLEAAAPYLTHLRSPESQLPAAPVTAQLSPKRLLVMRLDNIGDVMMTSPALRSLRENLPHAHITLMTSPGGSQVAPLLPWIDDVLPWRVLWQDLGRLTFDPQREWQLIETLKAKQFDAAIVFSSFSQSPYPAGLICALAGIPIRVGESKELDRGILTHPVPTSPDTLHQVDRNLRLVEAMGFSVRDRRLQLNVSLSARQSVRFALKQRGCSGSYLLLNPWTSCQSRNYDPLRFAAAARHLSETTQLPVVITGMEKDRERTQPILEFLGDRAIDLLGQTTLEELVALVDMAELLLTNNTSTMHIADAVLTPQVVLFAGTEYECQWRPRYSPSRLLRRPTVCNPCYSFACSYELQCLDIDSDTVVSAALELMRSTALKV